jgi:phosphoribosylglycinamide formyltransferase-1
MARTKVGVLISGSGSNCMALIEAARAADYPAEIALVVSNRPDAAGVEKARAAGVATAVIDHKPFGKNREAHERAIQAALEAAGVEFVALAGYMRIFTPWFSGQWSGRMINIHPSLLPAFPGLHPQQQALDAGVSETGCSVHWVIDGVDEGPVIGQARVPILPGDDEASVAARILAEEHKLYPACLAKAVNGEAGAAGA